MYTIKISYKGNAIEEQIALLGITDYVPTLVHQNSYSTITGRTTVSLVVLKISKPLIEEIHKSLPLCVTEITELVKGKQSINVDDFL